MQPTVATLLVSAKHPPQSPLSYFSRGSLSARDATHLSSITLPSYVNRATDLNILPSPKYPTKTLQPHDIREGDIHGTLRQWVVHDVNLVLPFR